MLLRLSVVLGVLFAVPALAEDAKAKAAREELERQLNQMVVKAPSRVRVDLAALDEPNYQLEEATFELDGRGLGGPSVSQLGREGTHLVWNGDVTPGKHTVKVLLVYANASSIVVSDEGGYKWRVGGAVSFDVQSGIEVHVTVTPSRDGAQADISKRFKLALPAKPVMLAKLDDGTMPEPVKPVVAVAVVVDAGTPGPSAAELAAEEKRKAAEAAAEAKRRADADKKLAAEAAAMEKQMLAAEAAEKKRLAAEEKKRKAAEAAEAKRLAAEEKKRKAAEALAYSKLTAAEKKQKAAEEAEAKRQAALEAQRQAAEDQKAVLRAAAEGNKPVAMTGQVDPNDFLVKEDAGATAAAEVFDAGVLDAGLQTAVVRVEPDAGAPVAAAPPTATAESEGLPWLELAVGGGVLSLALLIFLARRSARPPTLDD